VNPWGLAATPTGEWWTGNEARESSTLYSGTGRKTVLNVHVDGGPTAVVFNSGRGFVERGGGRSDPARFIYACEDGALRAWTPTVPTGWSTRAVLVFQGGPAALYRGLALLGSRLYVTDFHNARVVALDAHWQQLQVGFSDPAIPEWYAPFGIAAIDGHVFVTYAWRAPVNGNDAPTGGYVDEFDLDGRLVARVAHRGALNAPWGMAVAPSTYGRFGGALLVGNFGDGRINAYRRSGGSWQHLGALEDAHGKPLVINGLWGIAFGNGGMSGRADELFFTSGPHEWRGVTELGVHGLLGSISKS
jgi:uncharacterized protein (TIGR03118 family)